MQDKETFEWLKKHEDWILKANSQINEILSVPSG